MGRMSKLMDNIFILQYAYIIAKKTYLFLKFGIHSDEYNIKRRYKEVFNASPNLLSPETLNEKINWLKLYDRKDINTIVADKYEVRKYYESQFGKSCLIPLYFHTTKIKDINEENINSFPCIIKCNSGSGTWQILKSKDDVNWKELRKKCRYWMSFNHYTITQEWQYKNIKPSIIVEKLLVDSNGKIPNDYKFLFFNGELQFVYCSVDREGINKRVCYDAEWNKLPFTWVEKNKQSKTLNDYNLPQPYTFDSMLKIGKEIAKNWAYVRVDFFENEKKLYVGEITLHHGSGLDVFYPNKYDYIYGQKLDLSKINNK